MREVRDNGVLNGYCPDKWTIATDDDAPSLALIGRQLRPLISDLASVRDDMTVLTAIAMRQDGTLGALLTEVPAMHSRQHGRLGTPPRVGTARLGSD